MLAGSRAACALLPPHSSALASAPTCLPQDVFPGLHEGVLQAGDLQPDPRCPHQGRAQQMAHTGVRGHVAPGEHCRGLQESPRYLWPPHLCSWQLDETRCLIRTSPSSQPHSGSTPSLRSSCWKKMMTLGTMRWPAASWWL